MRKFSSIESVRIALSDLFVDTEICYEFIARQVKHLNTEELERILYLEVAPVCIGNMLTPIPPVWSGFEPEYLIVEINKHLQKFQTSHFYRVRTNFKGWFYKWILHSEWSKVIAQIKLLSAKRTNNIT